ncbi:hypothetical protein ARMSODRAFT_1021587 [Armillaria solidipes]|uniref:Uncharacterized protein n=1 Tax=Armillaria solidipes TaxID=1076256 RepID=A0A2H3BPA7_9AGAR|nr:hypothetical protein ARMSODRAFT_1021587 [Armillaria solidipes]
MPAVLSHLIALPTELVTEICAWIWTEHPRALYVAHRLLCTHRIFGDEARRQLFVYLMLRGNDDLEGWLLFLITSPHVLELYKTIFIDNPPIDGLKSIVSIVALRMKVSDHPIRLVLHRVKIGQLLSAMNRQPWPFVEEVVLYRCSYNEDHLRILFTLVPASSWNFPSRPRSSYTGHCGRPLPPISNALCMPTLLHLKLSAEFGPTVAYQSVSWLNDVARASMSLQSLTIAMKADDLFVVAALLRGASRSLRELNLRLIEGCAPLDLSICTRLCHLVLDVQMSNIAFVDELLLGARQLLSLSLNITCDKRDCNVETSVAKWKRWFHSVDPLDSVILRFSLEEIRGGIQSWRRALDEAVEIAEQVLYPYYIKHGMSIIGGVEGTRMPVTFDRCNF